MREILLFIFVLTSLNSRGQNPEKLLTKSELDSINSGHDIYKIAQPYADFEQTVRIYKKDGKIKCDSSNKASRYGKTGKLNALFTFDELGYLKTYQEYNSDGKTVYDCTYEIKTIGTVTYRLEHLKYYYEPNVLGEDGYRFIRIVTKRGPRRYPTQHKYGMWKYYDTTGKLVKSKDHGEIK